MVESRKKTAAVKVKKFQMSINFEYDINAACYAEAKEIMFRRFLRDMHRLAASADTVEDFEVSRNRLTLRRLNGGRGQIGGDTAE